MQHAHTEEHSGSLGSYLTGFALAIILTVIPFAVVMSGALTRATTMVTILGAAALQILVHLYYFLHLDGSAKERWNLTAIIFTAVIILLIVSGSVWIMSSLHDRLMIPGVGMVMGGH